jgi:hypothetical protein
MLTCAPGAGPEGAKHTSPGRALREALGYETTPDPFFFAFSSALFFASRILLDFPAKYC